MEDIRDQQFYFFFGGRGRTMSCCLIRKCNSRETTIRLLFSIQIFPNVLLWSCGYIFCTLQVKYFFFCKIWYQITKKHSPDNLIPPTISYNSGQTWHRVPLNLIPPTISYNSGQTWHRVPLNLIPPTISYNSGQTWHRAQ